MAAALLACLGESCMSTAVARTPRAPRAASGASSPSTEAILARVRATPADGLPSDEPVYRCGASYSSRPCGDAPPLDVHDDRSLSQRLQAEDVAARDQRLAAWYAAQRTTRDEPASAPRKVRTRATGCVQSATMACPPRQPRPRRAIGKTPSAAAPTAAPGVVRSFR